MGNALISTPSESPTGSAWSRHRAKTSKQIEIETLRLCAEKGVNAVTIDDIAKAAGISRRTFYRYFETIGEVLNAWPKRSLDRVCRGVGERPASESVREAFVRGVFQWGPSAEEQEVQVMAMEVVRRDPEGWQAATHRIQAKSQEAFEKLIAKRMVIAQQNPAYAPAIVKFLLASISYLVENAALEGKVTTTTDELDFVLNELTAILAV